jgi:hypothetical protein
MFVIVTVFAAGALNFAMVVATAEVTAAVTIQDAAAAAGATDAPEHGGHFALGAAPTFDFFIERRRLIAFDFLAGALLTLTQVARHVPMDLRLRMGQRTYLPKRSSYLIGKFVMAATNGHLDGDAQELPGR